MRPTECQDPEQQHAVQNDRPENETGNNLRIDAQNLPIQLEDEVVHLSAENEITEIDIVVGQAVPCAQYGKRQRPEYQDPLHDCILKSPGMGGHGNGPRRIRRAPAKSRDTAPDCSCNAGSNERFADEPVEEAEQRNS